MPSGRGGGGSRGSHSSSRGSGGSHRSSSSRSYSSSRSSSSSRSYSSYGSRSHDSHRCYHYYYDDDYYSGGGNIGYGWGIKIFLLLLFNLIFILPITMFNVLPECTYHMQLVKDDRDFYLNLIETAEAQDRVVTGEITGIKYNGSYGKWYITYKFTTKSGHKISGGYTYCIYEDRIQPLNDNTKLNPERDPYYIQIAYDSESSMADSMPITYKNYKLEDDGEYSTYKAMYIRNIVSGILCIILFVGLDVLFVWLLISGYKKYKEKLASAEKATATASTSTTSNLSSLPKKLATVANQPETPKKTKIVCKYCGSRYNVTHDKCPYCSASNDFEE